MKRYFFMANDLGHLESVERELLARGMVAPQIHVLSQDDAGATQHHLHQVHSLLRQDTIHSGEIGALIGLALAALAFAIGYLTGLPAQIGWVPFVFLCAVLLGFLTWEGGLFGIQMPHAQFRRFSNALAQGRHLLIVDVEPAQAGLERDRTRASAGSHRLDP